MNFITALDLLNLFLYKIFKNDVLKPLINCTIDIFLSSENGYNRLVPKMSSIVKNQRETYNLGLPF